MLLDSPDGPQISLFGPALAPASPSAPPANSKASKTIATYGRIGLGSSASAPLQRSLESRLRARLDLDGSIEFALTWKAKATPLGRRYCQLAASARRTSGQDCSGVQAWPTPQAHDVTTRGNTDADHHHYAHDLSNAAQLAGWPSPRANKWGEPDSHGNAPLTGWATPTAPRAHDSDQTAGAYYPATKNQTDPLIQLIGRQALLSSVETGSGGVRPRLNPAFSLWLMGFPSEWFVIAPGKVAGKRHIASECSKAPATRSSHKSPPSSSALS